MTCQATSTRLPAPTATAHWTDPVPVPADSPLAEHRRLAELTRPARTPRQVQLVYPDGSAELIDVRPYPPMPAAAPAPPWGLGDGEGVGVQRLPLEELGTEESWLAALAEVLRRYDPEREPLIATPGGGSGPAVAGLLFDPAEHQGRHLPCQRPPYPVTIAVYQDVEGRHLRCDHRLSDLSPDIAAQFLRHLHHQHEHGELMGAAELARVIELGRPRTELRTAPGTIHQTIARIAAQTPSATAITDGPVQVSYRELDERAARIAGGLRVRGVRPGQRVGVCLERTAELVVAALGVLKAGATYVPMDPAYPAERLAHITRDAGLEVVITAELLAEVRFAEPDSAPSTPDTPAYVIYTSGSTGRPKGVVVPHRNVLALLAATRAEYGLGAQDVWTWFHSAAFDFSVWEIWGCLLTGGRLVVVPYFVSREPDRFAELLAAESVTVLSQTPSAFAQLLEVDHAKTAPRLVVFGGEALDARMLLPWFDVHPESACRVVNMFGITETTVHVTHQTITRALALTGSRSVGPALPGWTLRVLDEQGRLQPPGVPGEICVGGVGLAEGYLNQETLTAQRFRADSGERLYHSGDLGRLRPDGCLEHLGRIDSQVKIRGFRIELDEIRNVLLEDPSVRAAAVVVRDEALHAYVVLDSGSGRAVRSRAANLLPEYMLPASVTALPSLPLTANGKLDVSALPVPSVETVAVVGESVADQLCGIWQEVLGQPVEPDDDFFELGGNSLLAVRIGAAMRDRGLPQLRLRELYRHPTIREIEELLSAGGGPLPRG